jgi:hypothetical protein
MMACAALSNWLTDRCLTLGIVGIGSDINALAAISGWYSDSEQRESGLPAVAGLRRTLSKPREPPAVWAAFLCIPLEGFAGLTSVIRRYRSQCRCREVLRIVNQIMISTAVRR